MRKLKNKKGFTLIELMIVVVIIGVLAALAIPRFMSAAKKAKISEAESMLKQIYKAAQSYYQENGAYPPAQDDIFGSGSVPTGLILDTPSGKSRFIYDISSGGSEFEATANPIDGDDVGSVGDAATQQVDQSLNDVGEMVIDKAGNITGGSIGGAGGA